MMAAPSGRRGRPAISGRRGRPGFGPLRLLVVAQLMAGRDPDQVAFVFDLTVGQVRDIRRNHLYGRLSRPRWRALRDDDGMRFDACDMAAGMALHQDFARSVQPLEAP